MTESTDRIGVTRQHRWMSADRQAELLKPRCAKIVSLGGGKLPQVDREDVEKLTRPGTIVELVHAFLLADPRRKKLAGGLKADFRAALGRLEKRGAVVVDVDASICSRKHRRALLALVDSDLARSNRGAKSATNGARSKGRPVYVPTEQELKDAKAIWRNLVDVPEWQSADEALRAWVNVRFTAARAYKLWGPRKSKRR